RPAPSVDDPGLLPQTQDRPKSSGARFDANARLLWEAIVHDDPRRALPFFFPKSAYQQTKDIPDPPSDWKGRLVRAFDRDVHALHRRLGADAATATFGSLEVADDKAQWVKPGHELNKLGYYRVYGTKLRFSSGGRDRAFDVTSLISWRGEWYVVHLSGFK
ncbi:MAG: hypothetical protein WCI05_19535, partial [Myxococcales bacterium]